MGSEGTIIRAADSHNRPRPANSGRLPVEARPRDRRPLGLIGAGLILLAGSCNRPQTTSSVVPTWELAQAEPFEPVLLGRTRVSFDQHLPEAIVQQLCEEFSLISITRPTDWRALQRALRLPSGPPGLDLEQGMIVGILANVGESADGTWPIQLEHLRRRGAIGSLEATFVPGVYYPLLTAGYLELVYAPGIRGIHLVTINHRQFVIHARDRLH